MKTLRGLGMLLLFLALNLPARAQVVFTDEFNEPVNYLTSGVAGTVWDGVYFGAGEFANTSLGSVAGSTSDCDADLSTSDVLTVTSTGTGWENTEDDGFFLFKNVTGDFSAWVHIIIPYDNGQYNTGGLQVRAAGPDGNPYGGQENYVSWTRFNEFGFGNYLRNEVNGVVTQINPNPGTGAGQGVNDTNYWLRIDRVGDTFNYYSAHYGPASNDWVQVAPATAAGAGSRPDLAGLPLEVGIMQATFEGSPPTHTVQFEHFSLTASNLIAATVPLPDTGLTAATNGAGNLALSWNPGAGSAGSVAVVWTGVNNAPKEAPADGITYTGNASYGSGSSLPATSYYVVYAGAGTNVTVSNLTAGTTYYAAAFGYSGSGSSITYTHAPATGSFIAQGGGGGGSGPSGGYTNTDNFNVSVNYLQNGLAGTIWDGVYFGSGEFENTAGGQASTVQCDANISQAGALTLQTTGTEWEGANDNGFFLFKVVPGDFSMVVEVNTPFNNAAYNTAGLQVRAFAPNGNAYNGSENFVSWTRFDEFSFANYLRNNVDGGVEQINPGDYPNSNYWVRIDRVNGTNFNFYQRSNSTAPWELESFPAPVNGTTLTRVDLAGLPLEVGIMHATFNGQLGVSFSNFSLTESNTAFAATPSAASNLIVTTNAGGNLSLLLSWTPGAGSAGSLVAMWTSTNLVKEMPANGFTYTGNPAYGSGSALPGASYSVVYAGTNSSVTVSNVTPGMTYYAGVFAYAGSGTNTSYSHVPATASASIAYRMVSGAIVLSNGDVYVNFTANPGMWYMLQYSDSLNPANWQNASPLSSIATNLLMTLAHLGGATGSSQRFYRVVQMEPDFNAVINSGNITSLQRNGDSYPTEYIATGGDLGNTFIRYLQTGTNWNTVQTATLSGVAAAAYSTSPDGTRYTADYQITNGLSGTLLYESVFNVQQDAICWTLNFTNLTGQPVVVGDLAVPLPMNTVFSGTNSSVFKHSYIQGNDSFVFWMRPDSIGPFLLMTPDNHTPLEYWDTLAPGSETFFLETLGGYEAYILSAAAGAVDATEYPAVTTQGQRWRQTNTSLTLSPGASQSYGFKFQWVSNYDGVRQALVNGGKVDVHVVPGMTVPTNLFAEIALDTKQTISSVTAEFPTQTQIQYLGATNVGANSYQLYQAQFSQLGENKLTISYGTNQTTFLEFFVTEPLETLVKKHAAFLSGKQVNDPTKWYNSLFCEWNMNDEVMLTPDNYDTLSGFVVYEVASDDPGESRPAYIATKEVVYPVQSEVTALDNYITNFVWGGLQRTTNETDSYGVYGIPDWHTLRTNNDLSLGRGYDYPHIVVMYYGMYQVAKYHPEITTFLTADEYLERAWGTAVALYTVVGGGEAYQIGLMNETITVDVINALAAEGMTNEAATLQGYWEQKVNFFVTGDPNLFGSEFSFDSTGFETQQRIAKYAVQNAGSDTEMGSANPGAFLAEATNFMATEIAANIFDRGWLETEYYHYGSDYRSIAGDGYVLSYMAPMGGWGVLDYGLNFATNPADYLRLGYGSILSSWATMNSGTPASNYGFWYPGSDNDGDSGSGFEPGPYNTTWLGQPMHRGNWYYSAEGNLGFCACIRAAATILADDPIFGRFCYGGTWTNASDGIEITPLDGVRRQFHALLAGGNLHLVLDNDNFASTQPLVLKPDLSGISFAVETVNPSAHTATLHLTASNAGAYQISNGSGVIATVTLQSGQAAAVALPMPAGASPVTFTVAN